MPGKQSCLNLSIFFISFQFCQNVQLSFDFESSVKLSFQQNSRVEFSFSCLTWYNFSSRPSFDFTFISWEAPCQFEILISCWRSEWWNLSVGYSFLHLQCGPRIRTERPNSSSRQIMGGSFLVLYYLELLPFPLWPNQVSRVVGLIFSQK